MVKKAILLVISSVLLSQFTYAGEPSAKKAEPNKVVPPATQATSGVTVTQPTLQAIEVVMPDGSKRVGTIINGQFIPIESAPPTGMTPVTIMTAPTSKTEEEPLWKKNTYEKKVFQIGQQLLTKNNISEKIYFQIRHDTDIVNAHAERMAASTVTVHKGLLSYVESDDELAAILAHEIAHLALNHKGRYIPSGQKKHLIAKPSALAALAVVSPVAALGYGVGAVVQNGIYQARERTSQQQETDADCKGLEYMKQAGYEITAMRTIILKITSDGASNVWRSHPRGSNRLASIDKKIAELENASKSANQSSGINGENSPVSTAEKQAKTNSAVVTASAEQKPEDKNGIVKSETSKNP